jgi:hypothetical protein
LGTKRRASRTCGTLLVCLDWPTLVGLAEDPIMHEEEWNFVEGAYLSTGDVSARSAVFAPASCYPTSHRQR